MKLLKENKPISGLTRIMYIIIGFIMLVSIAVYGLSLSYPLPFSFAGISANTWINAGIMVILALIGGTLLKSGILGKSRLD